ncbi:hypothetical protein GF362_01970 [Candidatus Dojkabacteria bacterium]|nr:hypothetical protein [Candidatus Dojkabacteria bacterium]
MEEDGFVRIDGAESFPTQIYCADLVCGRPVFTHTELRPDELVQYMLGPHGRILLESPPPLAPVCICLK